MRKKKQKQKNIVDNTNNITHKQLTCNAVVPVPFGASIETPILSRLPTKSTCPFCAAI